METLGNRVKRLSDIMLCSKDLPDFLKVSEAFVGDVMSLMSGLNLAKSANQEILWQNVHRYTISPTSREIWLTVISSDTADLPSFHALFHFLVMRCVNSIMSLENEERFEHTKCVKATNWELTKEEQEVVSYVAGYMIFSLKRKYKKLQTSSSSKEIAVAALQLLQSLETKGNSEFKSNSFLDFTHKWVEKVNRGGLVRVNDNMFIFVRRIENVVRQVLNIKFMKIYKGEDLRDILQKELEKSSLIDLGWDSLSRLLPNRDLAAVLKRQLICKWVDIRARSFVNCYVQLVKRKLVRVSKKEGQKTTVHLSKKAEQAMRKKLT